MKAIRIAVIVRFLAASLAFPGVQAAPDQSSQSAPDQPGITENISSLSFGQDTLSTGFENTCALVKAPDGSGGALCWGNNDYGQLGDGTTAAHLIPVFVKGLANGVSAIDVYGSHACALTSSGGVKCWGFNDVGQLGDGTTTNSSSPVDVVGLSSGVSAISVGERYTCALTSSGGVKCWGMNGYGALGDGTYTDRHTPVDVAGLSSGVIAISAGPAHTCALTTGGGVKCWGANHFGQLGDGTTSNSNTPINVVGLSSGVNAIAVGGTLAIFDVGYTCALLSSGAVKCWGINSHGELGDGTYTTRPTPDFVAGISTASAISSGGGHTCVLTPAGGQFIPAVMCWGENVFGELGDGTTTASNIPVGVYGLFDGGVYSGISAISTGMNHTCARLPSGLIKCWGMNSQGQLGDGATTDRYTPVNVLGMGTYYLASGQKHTGVILKPHLVKFWGDNSSGQTGNGTNINYNIPVQVTDLISPTISIGAGSEHSCAVLDGGALRCWGSNLDGQIGDGSTSPRWLPVQVSGLTSGVKKAAGGEQHTCALTIDGGVKCWGDNTFGQLGNPDISESLVPIIVPGLESGVSDLVSGAYHACALLGGGAVKCWGYNGYGGLGDDSTDTAFSPVDVTGLSSGVIALAAGMYHTCALTDLEPGVLPMQVQCWGYNADGELGDGSFDESHIPVDVLGLPGELAGIAVGGFHACVLTGSGQMWCWGYNAQGQLGDNTNNSSNTPVQVSGLGSGDFEIGLGRYHSCILLDGPRVQCWGSNLYGQLGDGTTNFTSTPVEALIHAIFLPAVLR